MRGSRGVSDNGHYMSLRQLLYLTVDGRTFEHEPAWYVLKSFRYLSLFIKVYLSSVTYIPNTYLIVAIE
jgi:hypothetical protein